MSEGASRAREHFASMSPRCLQTEFFGISGLKAQVTKRPLSRNPCPLKSNVQAFYCFECFVLLSANLRGSAEREREREGGPSSFLGCSFS